jgi:hypothetical protein
LDLPRPLVVHPRSRPHPNHPSAGAVWQGDWISTFAWLRSGAVSDVVADRFLDLAFHAVMPDHVLLGHPEEGPWDDVSAGLFAGWVHAPAAITWTLPVGAGRLTATTLRLGLGNGPMATALLDELMRTTASATTQEEPR